MKKPALALAAFLAASVSIPALCAQYGTKEEARAMLDRAAADLKRDKNGALEKMKGGDKAYRDRDLYPFCIGPDGKTTAHASKERIGEKATDLQDKGGKYFAKEMLEVAKEGKVSEVTYQFPRPGETQPAAKVSYVTKVGDQVCGVGYYK